MFEQLAGVVNWTSTRRSDARGSEATTKDARITLDTDANGRPDAFNPADLFLAPIAEAAHALIFTPDHSLGADHGLVAFAIEPMVTTGGT